MHRENRMNLVSSFSAPFLFSCSYTAAVALAEGTRTNLAVAGPRAAETVEAGGRDGLVALPPTKVLRRVLLRVASVVSGLLVQPFVGHMSDRRATSLGRRRPFSIGGALSIALFVIFIVYFADIGRILCNSYGGETRYGAIAVYLVGFWLFGVGNNTTHDP